MPMTETAAGAFRTLGPADAVPDELVVAYYLEDRKRRIAVARVGGRLHAFDDLCPCTEGEACPLSGGLLTGTTLMCQCHGSRFDVTTGAVLGGPATAALTVYAVEEADGDIRLRA
jgi:3-phenylpropionate/trans-cinnamate dioxygenase ferredoxin subunit